MRLVMNPREVAEAIATSPNEVMKYIESGQLPAYRQGRNWKIPISLLQTFIEEKAIAEAEERKSDEK